jgi:hypothetical protein
MKCRMTNLRRGILPCCPSSGLDFEMRLEAGSRPRLSLSTVGYRCQKDGFPGVSRNWGGRRRTVNTLICKTGSEQEFGWQRILSGFLQNPIFRPDRRHALAFSSRYRRFLYPDGGGTNTFRQVCVLGKLGGCLPTTSSLASCNGPAIAYTGRRLTTRNTFWNCGSGGSAEVHRGTRLQPPSRARPAVEHVQNHGTHRGVSGEMPRLWCEGGKSAFVAEQSPVQQAL